LKTEKNYISLQEAEFEICFSD